MDTDVMRDDETTLIAMHYALADALELYRELALARKYDALGIERLLQAVSLETLVMLKMHSAGAPAARHVHRAQLTLV